MEPDASHAPASSAVPIPISSSRVRSAARGAAVPRKPVSCKFSPRSLDDDLAGHLRVNRAEIRIRSRLAEREGELLVRIEHFGLERLWIVRADHRMGISSRFVHVTLVPTGTVSVAGPKLKLSIFTSAVAGFSCALARIFFWPTVIVPTPVASATARTAIDTLLLMFFPFLSILPIGLV